MGARSDRTSYLYETNDAQYGPNKGSELCALCRCAGRAKFTGAGATAYHHSSTGPVSRALSCLRQGDHEVGGGGGGVVRLCQAVWLTTCLPLVALHFIAWP